MDAATKPKVLFVYYTFTKQARKVSEDMESVFRDRGWDIERAEIEFTDHRYVADQLPRDRRVSRAISRAEDPSHDSAAEPRR